MVVYLPTCHSHYFYWSVVIIFKDSHFRKRIVLRYYFIAWFLHLNSGILFILCSTYEMPEDKNLVQCYNRGCGQLFDPTNNDKGKRIFFIELSCHTNRFIPRYSNLFIDGKLRVKCPCLEAQYNCDVYFSIKNLFIDVCCHHPGFPVFHDAYKGWSCCSKKSVDFTEFLNIKGCTLSKHSHVVCIV